jgi:hypothetical protein
LQENAENVKNNLNLPNVGNLRAKYASVVAKKCIR